MSDIEVSVRDGSPVVNVKINGVRSDIMALLPLEIGSYSDDGGKTYTDVWTAPEFCEAWIDANVSESIRGALWEAACSDGFEQGEDLASEMFGAHVKCYAAGRSGGWFQVDGIGNPEDWNAAEVELWDAFAANLREIADGVPRAWLWNLWANVFELEQETSAV